MAQDQAIADRLRELADEIEQDNLPEGWGDAPVDSLLDSHEPYKQVGSHSEFDLYVDRDGDVWAANADTSAVFVSSEIRKLNDAREEASVHFD